MRKKALPRLRPVVFRLTEEDAARLAEHAARRDLSRTAYARAIVLSHLAATDAPEVNFAALFKEVEKVSANLKECVRALLVKAGKVPVAAVDAWIAENLL